MKNIVFLSLVMGLVLASLPGWVLALGPVSIPFTNDFENYTNGTPLIDGTNGWYADSSNVVVQTNVVSSGTNAAQIPIDCTLSNRVVSAEYTSLWVQLDSRLVRYDPINTIKVDSNATVCIYVKSNGYLIVHNGAASPSTINSTNWVTLTNTITGEAAVPVTETNWTRIDIHQDFTAKTWDLFVNYVLLTNNIGFINTNVSALSSLGFYNAATATTYLDNVWVSTTRPPDMDQHGSNWLPYIVTDTSTFACVSYENHSVTQYFDIWKTNGYYDLWFTNTISLPGGETWLSLTPPTGTSTGTSDHQQITVTYNTLGLSPGTYTGLITVAGNDSTLGFTAGNSPTTMDVSMIVKVEPILSVSQTNLSQSIPKGSNPTNQSFDIWNGSGAPITPMSYGLSMSNDTGCMSLTVTNGTSTGEHDTIGVVFSDMSTYAAGTYTGRITVLAWDSETGYVPIGAETQTTELVVTVQIVVPAAPGWIQASDGTYTNYVAVNWSGITNAASYEVWRGEMDDVGSASRIATVTVTNYNDEPSCAGKSYYYWVRSVNAYGGMGPFTVSDEGWRMLATPGDVSASDGVYTNKVRVEWIGVTDRTGYEVWRNVNDSTVTAVRVATDLTGTNYDDTAPEALVVYYYWVKAQGVSYDSVMGGPDSGYRVELFTPSSVTASAGLFTNKVRVTWTRVERATRYQVWRCAGGPSAIDNRIMIGEITGLGYDDFDVTAGANYTYWIRAKNSAGISVYSGYDVGYADIGKADLELSSLVVAPATLRVGGRPVSVVFVLKNWGPRSLVVPDTRVKIALYLSRHERWGMGGEVALGSTEEDVTVSAGSQLGVSLSQTALAGLTVLPGMKGNYYVYVRGEPISPSTLVMDAAWSNNVVRMEGMIMVAPMLASDFDGDGKSDPAICELSSGQWQALLSGSGYALVLAKMAITSHNQQLVSSDYDRDGREDPGLYEAVSGQWQVLLSGSGYTPASVQFSSSAGAAGLSAVGDYDGDGKADPGIYESDSGQWQVLLSGSGYVPALVQLGGSPNVPAPADYDGDGKADPTVYDSSSGVLTVLLSASGYAPASARMGNPQFNPRPVPGDYDGDSKADPAVYEEIGGIWSILLSGSGYQLVTVEGWGGAGYRAVAGGDYDGDGKTDPAVYGEADGVWAVWLSGTGYAMTCFPFGGAGFRAVGEK